MGPDPIGDLTDMVVAMFATAHGERPDAPDGDESIVRRVRELLSARFGGPVPVEMVSECWTPERIAYWLYGSGLVPEDCIVPPPGDRVGAPSLFYLHSATGNVFAAHALDRQLPVPVVGVRAAGRAVPRTIGEFAAAYLPRIREFQPAGPYLFTGFSAGGLIAFELAVRLAELGAAVGPVILLDTEHPGRQADRPRSDETDLADRRGRVLGARFDVDSATPEIAAQAEVYARIVHAARQYTPGFLPGCLHVVTAEIGADGAAAWWPSAREVRAHVVGGRHDEKELLSAPTTLSVLRAILADHEGGGT